MILTYTKRPARAYVLVAAALGVAALAVSLPATARLLWDARYLMLAFCALTLGTRVYLKVPHAGSAVPLSAAFVMLTALLYGFGAAVPVAAAAAAVSSLRLSRRGRLVLFDAAAAAAATLLAGWSAKASGAFGPNSSALAAALAAVIFSLVRSAAESGQLTAYGRTGVGRSAPRYFLDALAWTFTAYLLVSSLAVLVAQVLAGRVLDGLFALAAVAGAADLFLWARRRGAAAPARALPAAEVTAAEIRAAEVPTAKVPAAEVPAATLPATEVSAAEVAAVEVPAAEVCEQHACTHIFHAAFEHAAIGMGVLSAKGNLVWVNRSLCDFLDYPESELMSTSLMTITHEDDLKLVLTGLKGMLKRRSNFLRMEVRQRRRGGEQVWALWTVARFQDARDNETYLVLQLQDITERKQSEEQQVVEQDVELAAADARHDVALEQAPLEPARHLEEEPVAGDVPERVVDELEAVEVAVEVGEASVGGAPGALGGELEVVFAERAVQHPRQSVVADVVAEGPEAEVVPVAEPVRKKLSALITLSGGEDFTMMSAGVTAGPAGCNDPEDILSDADTTVCGAEPLGEARRVVYDHSTDDTAVNILQIETDLRNDPEQDQPHLLYQPIVSLDNFKLCGFEALLPPPDPIPIAEETGQIIQLGEWALEEACRQMREWQEKYPEASPFFMSVNLSAEQFNHTLLIAQVDNVLRKTGLSPRQLKLEVTEAVVMENIDTATETLGHLRDLGVQLAIDDFGTGSSSLSHLHRFPIETLKIDRSFVRRMSNNLENVEIIRTIVVLAQGLGMDVVAEGVETNEQLKVLRDLECEYGQGYYFSRPSSPADVEKIIVETNENVRKVHMPEEAPAPPIPNTDFESIRMVSAD
jgi:PAS domain S-box-containing protein